MSARATRIGRPRFTGVTTYADPQGRYEFRHPSDWFRSTLDDDLDGVMVGPDRDDEATHFAIAVRDLEVAVTADDLPLLREGFDEGIAALPDVSVKDSSDNTYNDIVRLERVLTFSDGGEVRKRRVWSMYADHWQFIVLFQGATVDEYHYWLPMGNYCFTSFQLPMALWFATDPVVKDSHTG
jgi:hypothetical protein